MKYPSLKELQAHIPQTGQLKWIGIRPAKKTSLKPCNSVAITVDTGLAGDHYSRKGGKRQVTLIQDEHLNAVGAIMSRGPIDPQLTRRNLVVAGINLLALIKRQVRIGNEVVLEITGNCYPCSRMEDHLGDGGYSAMRGHGGVTARVICGGTIQLGDNICVIGPKNNQDA